MTPKIRMLCFVLINSVLLNLSCVWSLYLSTSAETSFAGMAQTSRQRQRVGYGEAGGGCPGRVLTVDSGQSVSSLHGREEMPLSVRTDQLAACSYYKFYNYRYLHVCAVNLFCRPPRIWSAYSCWICCVCVCVRERERERECVWCVCMRVWLWAVGWGRESKWCIYASICIFTLHSYVEKDIA